MGNSFSEHYTTIEQPDEKIYPYNLTFFIPIFGHPFDVKSFTDLGSAKKSPLPIFIPRLITPLHQPFHSSIKNNDFIKWCPPSTNVDNVDRFYYAASPYVVEQHTFDHPTLYKDSSNTTTNPIDFITMTFNTSYSKSITDPYLDFNLSLQLLANGKAKIFYPIHGIKPTFPLLPIDNTELTKDVLSTLNLPPPRLTRIIPIICENNDEYLNFAPLLYQTQYDSNYSFHHLATVLLLDLIADDVIHIFNNYLETIRLFQLSSSPLILTNSNIYIYLFNADKIDQLKLTENDIRDSCHLIGINNQHIYIHLLTYNEEYDQLKNPPPPPDPREMMQIGCIAPTLKVRKPMAPVTAFTLPQYKTFYNNIMNDLWDIYFKLHTNGQLQYDDILQSDEVLNIIKLQQSNKISKLTTLPLLSLPNYTLKSEFQWPINGLIFKPCLKLLEQIPISILRQGIECNNLNEISLLFLQSQVLTDNDHICTVNDETYRLVLSLLYRYLIYLRKKNGKNNSNNNVQNRTISTQSQMIDFQQEITNEFCKQHITHDICPKPMQITQNQEQSLQKRFSTPPSSLLSKTTQESIQPSIIIHERPHLHQPTRDELIPTQYCMNAYISIEKEMLFSDQTNSMKLLYLDPTSKLLTSSTQSIQPQSRINDHPLTTTSQLPTTLEPLINHFTRPNLYSEKTPQDITHEMYSLIVEKFRSVFGAMVAQMYSSSAPIMVTQMSSSNGPMLETIPFLTNLYQHNTKQLTKNYSTSQFQHHITNDDDDVNYDIQMTYLSHFTQHLAANKRNFIDYLTPYHSTTPLLPLFYTYIIRILPFFYINNGSCFRSTLPPSTTNDSNNLNKLPPIPSLSPPTVPHHVYKPIDLQNTLLQLTELFNPQSLEYVFPSVEHVYENRLTAYQYNPLQFNCPIHLVILCINPIINDDDDIPTNDMHKEPLTTTQFQYLQQTIPQIYKDYIINIILPFATIMPMEKFESLLHVHFIHIDEWENTFQHIQHNSIDLRLNMYKEAARRQLGINQ